MTSCCWLCLFVAAGWHRWTGRCLTSVIQQLGCKRSQFKAPPKKNQRWESVFFSCCPAYEELFVKQMNKHICYWQARRRAERVHRDDLFISIFGKRCKSFGVTVSQSFTCRVEFGSTFRSMASTVHGFYEAVRVEKMCLKRVWFNVAEAQTRWSRD